jgi:DNA-binding MarR family transcriptional regulator
MTKNLLTKILSLVQPADPIDVFVEEWRRERPDLDFGSVEITARLILLSGLLQRDWDTDAAANFDLGGGAFPVLLALRRVGAPFELTPTSLTREAYLSSGGMTQLLDRLEQRGLVVRRPHPTDRRGLLVQLTPDGVRLADDVLSLRLAKAEVFLAGLSPDERERLKVLLRALLMSLMPPEKDAPSPPNAVPS